MSAARPAFERVLFFEPEHTSAILHVARIAASEGRREELDSLARRILALNPTGEWAVEAKALRAFSGGDRAEQEEVIAALRTAVEGRVWNTARYVALAARDPVGALRLVALLTEATRPDEVRAFGHLALAHLALGRGHWRAARAELDRATRLDPLPAMEHHALLALAPFVLAAPEELRALRDTLRRRQESDRSVSLQTSHLANLHDGIHPELAAYLSAGLSLRLGDSATARRELGELERRGRASGATAIGSDAAHSIRARLAAGAGRQDAAIGELEAVLALEARVGLIGGSPFYSQGLERYLYAQLLEASGRYEEALRWYGSFTANSIFDLIYVAPARVRQGAVAERLGRRDEAALHYRGALAQWRGSDPELRPAMAEAEAGLARLAGRSHRPEPAHGKGSGSAFR